MPVCLRRLASSSPASTASSYDLAGWPATREDRRFSTGPAWNARGARGASARLRFGTSARAAACLRSAEACGWRNGHENQLSLGRERVGLPESPLGVTPRRLMKQRRGATMASLLFVALLRTRSHRGRARRAA